MDIVASNALWDQIRLIGPVTSKKDKDHKQKPESTANGPSRAILQCTEQAKRRAIAMHRDSVSPHETPATTESNPATLQLGENLIHRAKEFHVRAAASSPDMRNYLASRYGWKPSLCDCIDWHPHGRALTNMTYRKRVTITKFIHGWLPINKRMNIYDPSIPSKCAACNEPMESQSHFLYCKCSDRIEHRKTFRAKLEKWIGNRAPKSMQQLLISGLFEWSNSNAAALPASLNPELRQAAEEQQRLGWHQLWRGRLSSKWGDILAQHRLDTVDNTNYLGATADDWIRRFITYVWKGVLEMWDIRNKHQHALDINDERTTARLRNQIDCIYAQANELPLHEQIPFQTPRDDVIRLPLSAQKDWIEIHQDLLKCIFEQQKKREKLQINDIRTFFEQRPKPSSTSHDDKPP